MAGFNLVFRHQILWERLAGRVKAAGRSLPDNAPKRRCQSVNLCLLIGTRGDQRRKFTNPSGQPYDRVRRQDTALWLM